MTRHEAMRLAAHLLQIESIRDKAAEAIADSRDMAPRHPDDRDSADVLTDLIHALEDASYSED